MIAEEKIFCVFSGVGAGKIYRFATLWHVGVKCTVLLPFWHFWGGGKTYWKRKRKWQVKTISIFTPLPPPKKKRKRVANWIVLRQKKCNAVMRSEVAVSRKTGAMECECESLNGLL